MEKKHTLRSKNPQTLTQDLASVLGRFCAKISKNNVVSILFSISLIILLFSTPRVYYIISTVLVDVIKKYDIHTLHTFLIISTIVCLVLLAILSLFVLKAKKIKKKTDLETKFLMQIINTIPMEIAISSTKDTLEPYIVNKEIKNRKNKFKKIACFIDYIHRQMNIDLVAYYKKAMVTNTEQAIVIKSPESSKIKLHHLIRFNPINLRSKRHILITVLDIYSSYKETERAEANNKNMSEFLSNLSHEVRTPLNSIIGFTSLLPETEDKETKQEFLTIINKKSAELNLLMNKILFLSKLESGKYTPIKKITNLNKLFFDTVDNTINDLKTKEVKHYNEKFYRKYKCNIDLDLITIALTNLASNACQFTKKGSILTGFVSDEKECIFYIKDTGIGISKQNQQRIFNHFIKGNSFNKGSGLGINICLNITKILGGKFGFYSKKEEGTFFWLSFPTKGNNEIEPGMEKMAKDRFEEIQEIRYKGIWFSKDGQGRYISYDNKTIEEKPIFTDKTTDSQTIRNKTINPVSRIALSIGILLNIPSMAYGNMRSNVDYTSMLNDLITEKEAYSTLGNTHWISSIILTISFLLFFGVILNLTRILIRNFHLKQTTNLLQSLLYAFPHRIQIFSKDKDQQFNSLVFDNINNKIESNNTETADIICNKKEYLIHRGEEERLLVLHEDVIEIMEAKNRAEKSKQFKTTVLSNMSHDIRTPLNIIVGFSSLLAETHNKQELEEYIGFINQNTQYLLSLLTDIIRISELQTTTLNTEETCVDFGKMDKLLINTTTRLLEESGKTNDITLITNNPFNELCFFADSPELIRTITNLLTNAVKYTFYGTITTNIFFKNDMLYFCVKDTGIGIKKDKIEDVFKSYKKLSTAAPGSGLGMALSTTIVKKHHGKIGVYSEIDKGSLFWFCFKPHIEKLKYKVFTNKEEEIRKREIETTYEKIKQSYSPF